MTCALDHLRESPFNVHGITASQHNIFCVSDWARFRLDVLHYTNHPTGIIVHSVVVNAALQTREHGTPLAELQGSLLGHRRPLLVIVELSLVLDVIQSKASCVIIDPSSSRCHVLVKVFCHRPLPTRSCMLAMGLTMC